MVSVSYKNLVEYIHEDNYDDFCAFLNNKRVIVDDRDEVIIFQNSIYNLNSE